MTEIIKLYASANIRISELERENTRLRTALVAYADAADMAIDRQCPRVAKDMLAAAGIAFEDVLDAAQKGEQP
jgi:hypothetical protein